MNIKDFFKKYGIHFIAVALFIIVAVIYFSPQFGDYAIKQHDIKQFKGMSNEIVHYRETAGEEPLWTNSMFGGMPATQISVQQQGNVVKEITRGFLKLFPVPAGVFLLHVLCFYILALFLRIRPIIGILGAFAFAFASYEIIILQAGHNSKAIAVAFLPAVLGAFIYAFRQNWKWGALLSALFMTFELSANHLQVTYYMAFLLGSFGLYYLVESYRKKELKKFGFAAGGVLVGYLLAVFINYGNITMTNEYAKYTIRGKNDLTVTPEGKPLKSGQKGLDKDYITQWSYGKGESFTLISPYIKGSHSGALRDTRFMEMAEKMDMSPSELKAAENMPLYWGDQPITSGPVYIGVIVFFLALLALVFVKDRSVWVLFGISVLALLLSWGKNFMGLTEFFIDYVPGYDKFRTVTIILVLVELCMPVLAVLLLQKLYDEREKLKEQRKNFLIVSGAFLIFLLGYKAVGGGTFTGAGDQNIIDSTKQRYERQIMGMNPQEVKQNWGFDVNNKQQLDQFIEANMEGLYTGMDGIKKVRKEMFSASTTRSFVIGLFAVIICALFFYTSISPVLIVSGLAVLTLIDFIPTDLNYLGKDERIVTPDELKAEREQKRVKNEYLLQSGYIKKPITEQVEDENYLHWQLKQERNYPIDARIADYQILEAELKEHPELKEVVKKGEQKGIEVAEELGYEGWTKLRVIDSYRFQALNAVTNYRVADYNSLWSSTDASYFHKSLGGYHGAKLRRIQNLFEFQIANSNNEVMNMLNVKYFIQGNSMNQNPSALGNAWAVKKVKTYDSANDEIHGLGKKFVIKQAGGGTLFINNEPVKEQAVYGQERIVYLPEGGDSIRVPISNGITKGLKVYFVADANGSVNFIPEMTLESDTSNSFLKLVEIECVDDFRAAQEAVMDKKMAAKLSSSEYTGEATVTMKEYKPNYLKYNAAVKGKQLLVFSEIYYPVGWTAFVDGKPQEILRVDYLLRGLEVGEGNHTIEFKYDDASYHRAGTMASIGSVLLLLLFGGAGFIEYRSRRAKNE